MLRKSICQNILSKQRFTTNNEENDKLQHFIKTRLQFLHLNFYFLIILFVIIIILSKYIILMSEQQSKK